MQVSNDDLKSIKITPLLDTLKLDKIDDATYFSSEYKNYISNSRLGLLKSKGVQAFFDWEGSTDYNPSFAFGTALHQLVLQPELFELIDSVYKPTAKAGLVADYLYKNDGTIPSDDDIKIASIECNYYKDKLTTNRLLDFKSRAEIYWRDRFLYEQSNPPVEGIERIYTDEKSVNLLKSCLDSVSKNKDIQKLLNPEGVVETPINGNEQAILLDIEASSDFGTKIYHLKAKLDNFSINKEENIITVNDLKTTSKLAVEFNPSYFSYQRELAIYSWLLKLCCKKYYDLENPTVKGNFLVVSTIPEYTSLVYPMTPQLFKQGWNEFLYLLKTVIYFDLTKNYDF